MMMMMEIVKCPTCQHNCCHIIQLTLDADMPMLGISTGFLNFFMTLHHHFFLRSTSGNLKLKAFSWNMTDNVSIMRKYKLAGHGSGLSIRLRELLGSCWSTHAMDVSKSRTFFGRCSILCVLLLDCLVQSLHTELQILTWSYKKKKKRSYKDMM